MKFDEAHDTAAPEECLPETPEVSALPDLFDAAGEQHSTVTEQERIILNSLHVLQESRDTKLTPIDNALLEASATLFESLAKACRERLGKTSSRTSSSRGSRAAKRKK